MTIEVKNADVIIRLVKEKLERAKGVFEQALSDEATRIVARTRRGQDVDGSGFRPYSKGYAKYRAEKGRNTSPVDLTFTGKMLAAIQSKVEDTPTGVTGTIYFASAEEALKASYNQVTRPFFGLSDEQVARIRDKVEKA